jgi:CBS domain-containing protein
MTSKFELVTAEGSYRAPSYQDATVRDAMHRGVLHCQPETPLTDVARMMGNYRVHAIVVTSAVPTDDEADEQLWGVVTDVMVVLRGDEARGRTAGDVASRNVVTVTPSDGLRDAARRMLEHDSSHAVVVDEAGRHPIGVVSTLDVADVIGWG